VFLSTGKVVTRDGSKKLFLKRKGPNGEETYRILQTTRDPEGGKEKNDQKKKKLEIRRTQEQKSF